MTPPVEVIVVEFGAPDLLDKCLESLGGAPVVVVDNSSDADILRLATACGPTYVDPGQESRICRWRQRRRQPSEATAR